MELAVAILAAFSAVEAIAIAALLFAAQRERSRLLDRIMARNWGEFYAGQKEPDLGVPYMSDEQEARLEQLAQQADEEAREAARALGLAV